MDERNEVGTGAIIPMGMSLVRKPAEILREAREAAQELINVIKQKLNPVIFNKEQYLEFEDWQTCGRFYGLTAKITWTRFVEVNGAIGYEAGADVINNVTGMVISAAEAMCLNDEEKWSKRPKYEWQDVLDKDGKKIYDEVKKRYKSEKVKVGEVSVPLFQLKSMAQTRAGAKALRNVLAWVVVLAGFKPNVAEELTGDEFDQNGNPKANIKPPQRKSENGAAPSTPPPSVIDKMNQMPPEPPAADMDVFETLEKELYDYCGGDEAMMAKTLLRLSSFVNKHGKEVQGRSRVEDFKTSKNPAGWAGSTLDKLREEMSGNK